MQTHSCMAEPRFVYQLFFWMKNRVRGLHLGPGQGSSFAPGAEGLGPRLHTCPSQVIPTLAPDLPLNRSSSLLPWGGGSAP